MNTTHSNQQDSEQLEDNSFNPQKDFKKPITSDDFTPLKRQRIRLEVRDSGGRKAKGHIDNRFLLREAGAEIGGSQDSIQGKRQHFKALFEAILKRK